MSRKALENTNEKKRSIENNVRGVWGRRWWFPVEYIDIEVFVFFRSSWEPVPRVRRRLRERERENNLTHFFNYWHKVYVHTMSLVKRAWLPTTSWERFTDLSLLSGQRSWLAMPKNGVKNSLWMMYLNTTTKRWALTIREKILLLLMVAIFKVEVPLQNFAKWWLKNGTWKNTTTTTRRECQRRLDCQSITLRRYF